MCHRKSPHVPHAVVYDTIVDRLQTDLGPNRLQKKEFPATAEASIGTPLQFSVWFAVDQLQAHRQSLSCNWSCRIPFPQSQLLQRYRKRETYLEVNLGHVSEFRPQLLDMLTFRPVVYLPLFEQASCFFGPGRRCPNGLHRLNRLHRLPTPGIGAPHSEHIERRASLSCIFFVCMP